MSEQEYESYTSFAQVYDLFMDNVPYEEWAQYLQQTLYSYGIKDGLVLDLGCGTGKLTRMMAAKGFDMIGVDCSMEMLEAAREAQMDNEDGILYLLQDMREFELYGTVRAIYSACDSINYILEEDELTEVFRLVDNYLDPDGLFIFDINSPYKYEKLLADNTFAENRWEGSFIWENDYDATKGINEYMLTLYIEEEEGKYQRFEEVHYQRSYTLEQIQGMLTKAGLKQLAVYDAYTKQEPREDSERYTILAMKQREEKRND